MTLLTTFENRPVQIFPYFEHCVILNLVITKFYTYGKDDQESIHPIDGRIDGCLEKRGVRKVGQFCGDGLQRSEVGRGV